MKEFSKKLLFADYIIAIALVIGYFVCVTINGIYANQYLQNILQSGIDVPYATIPQLLSLDGFGILLGTWIVQLGVSSGSYYLMCKSDHKIQLPMKMIDTIPDEIKEQLDMNQLISTILSTTDY